MANNYLQFSFVIRELTPELSSALEEQGEEPH